uniref:Uncharacterized protein n=1 Tax=Canis lupus familiaris TaxID=9615 RepID=A0A8C0MZI3_CANLF
MAWPNIFQRGTLFSRFSHHHVVVFLLTFFRYSLLHTSRKTFSNVKVSISKQWTPSAFNKSISLPVEIWSSNHLFPRAEEATLFLGTLDTIFLFSYAVTRSCFWSLECLCFSGQYFGSMPSFFCSAIRL